MRKERRNHFRETGRLIGAKRFRQAGAHHLWRGLLRGLLESLFGIGNGRGLSGSCACPASDKFFDGVSPAHRIYSGITSSWPGRILSGSESLSRLASKIFWYLFASP